MHARIVTCAAFSAAAASPASGVPGALLAPLGELGRVVAPRAVRVAVPLARARVEEQPHERRLRLAARRVRLPLDMNQWFAGTFKTSRIEPADGGGTQRASCVVYDAAGAWALLSAKQLTYWHCLDDEQWHRIAT